MEKINRTCPKIRSQVSDVGQKRTQKWGGDCKIYEGLNAEFNRDDV